MVITPKPILQVHSLSKRFPGVQALKEVDFDLYRGEIHCLVGANGAGKSTLVKILSGIYHKDQGDIYYKDKKIEILSPKDARNLGIATVFQELDIVPYLTLAENIFLENYPKKTFLRTIDYKELFSKARSLLDYLGEREVNPSLLATEVSVAIRQMIIIARALVLKAEVVIFDEPTAVLTVEEQGRLFRIIRELRDKGAAIIYISHRLEEIIELGDRVTVFRDGMRVSTRIVKETNLDQFVGEMMGKVKMPQLSEKGDLKKIKHESKDIVLSVVNLCSNVTKPKLKNISFELKKGEILGIFGFVGSGRTELAKCLTGHFPVTSGEIWFNGKPFTQVSPWAAVRAGMALAPEERKTQGLFLDLSVALNILLPCLRQLTRVFNFLDWTSVTNISASFVEELEIKTPTLWQQVRYLSGGNQQKLILARWLAKECKVLLLDEPTRGVDVGGKREIMKLITKKAEEGVSFVIISSEAEELLEICDRLIVLSRGEVMGSLDTAECNIERLLRLASGIQTTSKDISM